MILIFGTDTTPTDSVTLRGAPGGAPFLGVFAEAKRGRLPMLVRFAREYGDFIPFTIMGKKVIQVNHPALVRQVLVDNHKNYYKSNTYERFEAVLGLGLLTSNGDKWKRDRQKIQPMFRREQVEGYYFQVIRQVCEKYKQRWLELTQNGPAQIDLSYEMACITIEVILRALYGKDNLDEQTIRALHKSYSVFLDYLQHPRTFPKVDLCKTFRMPSWREFDREVRFVEGVLDSMARQYRGNVAADKFNMLALLIEAQKQDPENFTEKDLRDHCVSMVFAGFETTSTAMSWIWYALDGAPRAVDTLVEELRARVGELTVAQLEAMPYLDAVLRETMRIHPPFWVTSRRPVQDDFFGSYRVEKDTVVLLPQIIMHRHPRWWENPNAFLPERFLNGALDQVDPGLYFPFSQGPRKCSGYRFAELEAKTAFATLLPHFSFTLLNSIGNHYDPGISLKPQQHLMAEIRRRA